MRSRKETLEDMGEYRERFSKARPGALAGWPLLGATCFIAIDLLLDIRELLMQAPTAGTGGPDVEVLKDEGNDSAIADRD
jgi:hypothetical protein